MFISQSSPVSVSSCHEPRVRGSCSYQNWVLAGQVLQKPACGSFTLDETHASPSFKAASSQLKPTTVRMLPTGAAMLSWNPSIRFKKAILGANAACGVQPQSGMLCVCISEACMHSRGHQVVAVCHRAVGFEGWQKARSRSHPFKAWRLPIINSGAQSSCASAAAQRICALQRSLVFEMVCCTAETVRGSAPRAHACG